MFAAIMCMSVVALQCWAATVLIKRVTGTSGSQTLNEITSGTSTLNTADAASDGTAHPIQIPASGTNYSYWASNCLVCSVAPVTQINNVILYTSGTNPMASGLGCNLSTVASANGTTTSNYTQATGTPGVTGPAMDGGSGYGNGITTATNIYSYTAAAPLSLTGEFTTGTDTAANNSTGRFCEWFIEQLTVASSATFTGVTPSTTVTVAWDEL